MLAVPGATAATVKFALDEPAAIVTDAGTVATAALLLASATVAPADGAAALSVTVPCSLPPAARVGVLRETDEIAVELVGDVEDPPHCAALRSAAIAAMSLIDEGMHPTMCVMPA